MNEGQAATPTAEPPPPGDRLKMRRLLIAEDDEGVAGFITTCAEAAGFEVACVVDGRRAIESLGAAKYDLLITDMLMPERDGIEVMRHARRVQPDIVIVAISGGGRYLTDSLQAARFLGADHVLKKPFGIKEIKEVLGAGR